ncbi:MULTISPECIES: hypothetical protein [Flavobacteriaceae]|uniref:hypothetical protein n=1 Tax=Flavobacteriaceae TaxID=49546 RepID=UPI0010AE0E2E|nr:MULTISPECIES: hypothetical protein [Flavobacteriaceae]NJB37239.1 hypothetical protein [Croceivirga sp. JEA036]TKD61902.1 hypothetical protein FBT53_11020 [Flavobacterium sp. ASW18X]
MKRIFASLLVLFLLCSCSEEQDFDQIDDLVLEPTIASSIFYFESNEDTIDLAGVGPFYSQEFTFEAFNESFIQDNVVEAELTYQLENTTNKALRIIVEFLDEAGNPLDSQPFSLEPHPTTTLETIVNYGPSGKSLDILRNTKSIRINGENQGDSTTGVSGTDPKVIFKSSAALSLSVE